MSVQELSLLHRRYVDLSDRFKAAWTFHQFLLGVNKVFTEPEVGRESMSFQAVYASLKGISQNLNAAAIQQLREQLDKVERELETKVEQLLVEDSRISPSLLRQFFQRITNYDEKILIQLLKFFVYNRQAADWENGEAIDKADFLMTKLGEEIEGAELEPLDADAKRLIEVLHSLWTPLAAGLIDDEQVGTHRQAVGNLRDELEEIDNLEELDNLQTINRYRQLKHALGRLYFEPQLCHLIVRTNLVFRHTIQRLYLLEERRINAEFNEVFELERQTPLDEELERDLSSFRGAMELFERRLEDGNVRLAEVAGLREQVRDLIGRLKSSAREQETRETENPMETLVPAPAAPPPAAPEPPAEPGDRVTPPATTRRGRLTIRTPHVDLIGEPLRQLLRALEQSDAVASPKAVTVTPELQPLRVMPREVIAFRRLQGEGECDREFEQFLLEAAAIRVLITLQAEEIIGLINEVSPNGDEELFRQARETNRLADAFECRFSHYIHQALMAGDTDEARALQWLRMRLMRDYAGLYILANEP